MMKLRNLPKLVINAVTLKHTIDAFQAVIAYLPSTCILSGYRVSVKTGLQEFYASTGMRYVSHSSNVWTHICKFSGSQSPLLFRI